MTDIYLFRGKRKDNKEWVVGHYAQDGVGRHHITQILKEYPWVVHNVVDPVTVGQCTGLKDRNGKRVFRGDYVVNHGMNNTGYLYGITFDDLSASFVMISHKEDQVHGIFADGFEHFEVVGNFYDNDKFLEVDVLTRNPDTLEFELPKKSNGGN